MRAEPIFVDALTGRRGRVTNRDVPFAPAASRHLGGRCLRICEERPFIVAPLGADIHGGDAPMHPLRSCPAPCGCLDGRGHSAKPAKVKRQGSRLAQRMLEVGAEPWDPRCHGPSHRARHRPGSRSRG